MSLSDILDSTSKDGSHQRMVEMGKIKIGGKSSQVRKAANGSEWRAPEKWDHFVITTMNRDTKGDLIVDKPLMDQLLKKYGDDDGKLRRIPIRVLSDDIEDIVQSAFVWYGGKSVGARSDGKTITWFNNPEPAEFGRKYPQPVEQQWEPSMLEWKNPKGTASLFKAHTNFNCVIAANEARWGGVYKFRTTSIISLKQLHASLLHLSQLTGGILCGMPLTLVMRPMQVAPDGKPSTIYVVHVELHGPDMMELQKQAMAVGEFRVKFADRIQETTRQYRKLLAGPGTESDAEASEISEEFSPETSAELSTLPADTSYGLLDSPIEPEQPIQTTEPVIAPEPEPDAPIQSESAVEPEKPTKEVTTQDDPDEISDQLSRDWPDVKEALFVAAKAGKPDITRVQFERGISVACVKISRKNREKDIRLEKRREWYDSMRAGTFEFSKEKVTA